MTVPDNTALIADLQAVARHKVTISGGLNTVEYTLEWQAATALEAAAAREAELQKQLDAYVASTNLRS